MSYNYIDFLENMEARVYKEDNDSINNLSKDELTRLKSFLTLDDDLSPYVKLYKKFGILDNITSELYEKKSTEAQVESILNGYIPISYDKYPLLVFLVLKNYRSQVKSLYIFLKRLTEGSMLNIIESPYFQGKYLLYLSKILKNNENFVAALISSGRVDNEMLEILSTSSESEVLFRVANLKYLLSENTSMIKQLLSNPYTPDESTILLRQLLLELNIEKQKQDINPKEDEERDKNKGDTEKTIKELAKTKTKEQTTNIEDNLYKKVLNMKPVEKIKLALKGNKSARALLIKDPNKQVSLTVLKNPRITEDEIDGLVKNKSTPEHLIREITRNRGFMKEYNILKGILMHPKTPLEISMRYINNLYIKDIEMLSKSREIPAALKNQAVRLYLTKTGGKK